MRHVRNSDPMTSFEAAASSTEELTSLTQRAILVILEHRAMTDIELVNAYRDLEDFGDVPRASESGIRSRRAELVERGLVEPSGDTRKTDSGRNAIVWQVKRV